MKRETIEAIVMLGLFLGGKHTHNVGAQTPAPRTCEVTPSGSRVCFRPDNTKQIVTAPNPSHHLAEVSAEFIDPPKITVYPHLGAVAVGLVQPDNGQPTDVAAQLTREGAATPDRMVLLTQTSNNPETNVHVVYGGGENHLLIVLAVSEEEEGGSPSHLRLTISTVDINGITSTSSEPVPNGGGVQQIVSVTEERDIFGQTEEPVKWVRVIYEGETQEWIVIVYPDGSTSYPFQFFGHMVYFATTPNITSP